MKKVIIGLSSLIVLTFVIIFAINAQDNNQQGKSEVSQGITCCTSMDKCCGPSDSKISNCSTMKCDPANCKAGKCDPATCKGNNCDPATCKTNCGGAATALKCGPMNCNR